MRSKVSKNCKGLTLVELIAAAAILSIIMLTLGVVLVDSNKGFQHMYSKVHAGVITDGIVAQKIFDSIARKSISSSTQVDEDGTWIRMTYFQNDQSQIPDRYALFYLDDSDLRLDTIDIESEEVLSTQTVCSDVASCSFIFNGNTAQMSLELDDGQDNKIITSAAFMHN